MDEGVLLPGKDQLDTVGAGDDLSVKLRHAPAHSDEREELNLALGEKKSLFLEKNPIPRFSGKDASPNKKGAKSTP